MTTIIHRSSCFHKHLFENTDIAYFIDGHPTTFADIKKTKIERQKKQLKYKRDIEFIYKPCIIWVFKNPQLFPFGGWWCYIKTYKDYAVNFRNPDSEILMRKIMEVYPLGFLPMPEQFYEWMIKFEKKYHCYSKYRKKNAKAKAWCKIQEEQEQVKDIKLTKDELL